MDTDFPKLGMKFSRFEEFFVMCGGREALRDKTTTEVCEKFLKPYTISKVMSYCDILLEADSSTRSDSSVSSATVFISHAWSSKFLEVVDAFINHLVASSQSDAVIWFDLFSNNQHQTSIRPFEWWCNTFQSAIRDFGHTILVLTPWRDPVPLTRSWCLWEIYSSVVMKSKLDIAIVASQQSDFINALTTDFESINKMVATIDIKKSKAFKDEDRVRILQAVEQSEGGISAVNQLVFQQIWQSLTAIAVEALSHSDRNDIKTYNLMNSVALFLQNQGKYEEAAVYFSEALDASRSVLGNSHPDTIVAINNMGNSLCKQRKYEEALLHCKEALRMSRSALGSRHRNTLTYINNVGTILGEQGWYEEASVYCREALDLSRAVLGNSHPDTVACISTMGAILSNLGRYEEASVYCKEALELSRSVLGNTHPDTMASVSRMGSNLANQGKFQEAIDYYKEAGNYRRTVLGNTHPDTLVSISNIGSVLCSQGNYEEAALYLEEALTSQIAVLGADDPGTKNTEGNFGIVMCGLGRVQDGRRIIREVLQCLLQQGYSEDHSWIKKFRKALAEVPV